MSDGQLDIQIEQKKYKSCPEDSITEIKANNFNDTPVCDDDAHKAVLCTHSNIL